jgi:hypothetical protein
VIEVTNDRGSSWTMIDRRDNNMDLNGSGIIQTFRISTTPNGEFRYIRIRLIGPTHSGDYYLRMCAFELFGQFQIRESTSMSFGEWFAFANRLIAPNRSETRLSYCDSRRICPVKERNEALSSAPL